MHGVSGQTVANSRIEISAARLMVMQTAHAIDLHGAKAAKYAMGWLLFLLFLLCLLLFLLFFLLLLLLLLLLFL
jgi:hypothetical protein